MSWKNWIISILILSTAGWMLLDGTRALVVGDYVTPTTGDHAGQLGPWANLVEAVGIEPRSTLMKSIFVIYGLLTLVITVCFVLKLPWVRPALIVACIVGLWYLPFGTITGLIVLFLLLSGRRRPASVNS
jgi:hypothetical protein